jgi:hypothetical protein
LDKRGSDSYNKVGHSLLFVKLQNVYLKVFRGKSSGFLLFYWLIMALYRERNSSLTNATPAARLGFDGLSPKLLFVAIAGGVHFRTPTARKWALLTSQFLPSSSIYNDNQ